MYKLRYSLGKKRDDGGCRPNFYSVGLGLLWKESFYSPWLGLCESFRFHDKIS